jgi:hypothetical protein
MLRITLLHLTCGIALSAAPLLASAQIFRCEGANGVVEYSNSPNSSRDRNCRPLDLPQINTIPAPKPPPPAAPARPAAAPAAGGQGAGAAASGSPASFPRVDTSAQRTRDQDRRRILEDELRREEARLTQLRGEFNSGEPERRGDERNFQTYLDRVQRLKEDIARSESAVASLRREMGALRD